MFLVFIIFDPTLPFCKGYSLCNRGDFKKWSHFSNNDVFRAVFCTAQLLCSCRIVFCMFLAFLILDPNRPFCKGYSLCMGYSLCKMAHFQNCRISRIFGVSSCGFLHRTTLLFLWNSFSHVFNIFSF